MFEKSLYDLIRGMRNHKGHEREYIQNCLKECRSEIRSQDMDVKATALLKLIYLEMVGHDMSWASFNVLEVMSSPKYHQKRVGYLGAVQTFRPDTEVLMLATNLLKKDLTASLPTIISLPTTALPHIITPSLALSVFADLIPRMSHSNPSIRKKTLVTLYRMALVYPETLRAAWPKFKERLMDKTEHPSVTAAIVNVVCELGWRRPMDFLALAPRLFELLVDGGNNWMAIKLIKLFATLTPLEPRLVQKLLPPLTNIIRSTPAMSLLYECINGIIQGGILGEVDDILGREEIASLCVTKLRGMIVVNSDANLKYVALLAFNKIVVTHPLLVAQQEDVILGCIDSEDMTIRIKALDLVQGMVSSDNLVKIVSRLMRQLNSSSVASPRYQDGTSGDFSDEGENSESKPQPRSSVRTPQLSEEYTADVIERILQMCSQNNYGNLVDFEWYIDVLTQLVRLAPRALARDTDPDVFMVASKTVVSDIAERIGNEVRNVAVKVKAVRQAAVRAAECLFVYLDTESSGSHSVLSGALKALAWTVGEYACQLLSPEDTLGHLLQIAPRIANAEALASSLQSIMKIFTLVAGDQLAIWSSERKAKTSLLMARIIHVLEPLTQHSYLEVQERAVEFVELMKLTAEAVSRQAAESDDVQPEAPLLLTQALPSLFTGWDLNSVAVGAQANVPVPVGIDLDEPIHPDLPRLLAEADTMMPSTHDDEFDTYYYQKPSPTSIAIGPAINRLADAPEEMASSYQQVGEKSYPDPDIVARRKAEWAERNRDDPFYIRDSRSAGMSTPIHNILEKENGPSLDIDLIPIMQLDLENISALDTMARTEKPRPKPLKKMVVAVDETLVGSGAGSDCSTPRNYEPDNNSDGLGANSCFRNLKQSLLQVDSSHLDSLAFEDHHDGAATSAGHYERQATEEAEMQQAMREVERLRLEMQRAKERISAGQGVPDDGVAVVKRAAKKNGKGIAATAGGAVNDAKVVSKLKKKKKNKAAVGDGVTAVKKKKALDVPSGADGEAAATY